MPPHPPPPARRSDDPFFVVVVVNTFLCFCQLILLPFHKGLRLIAVFLIHDLLLSYTIDINRTINRNPLRARRALLQFKVYLDSALLVLNGISLNFNNALLALNRRDDLLIGTSEPKPHPHLPKRSLQET